MIGMAGKFPGCADLREFWDLLANGRDAVTEIPAERWNVDEFFGADPDAPGKIVSRSGGFLAQDRSIRRRIFSTFLRAKPS